jgi:hypothetical protein
LRKVLAAAAIWKFRTGEGQDIKVDVRKALRRFCCFFEGKWETINGRPPAIKELADMTGLTVAATKSRLYRARPKLRHTIQRTREQPFKKAH